MVKMHLVRVGSIWFEVVETFWDRKLCLRTCHNSVIFCKFCQFFCMTFCVQNFSIPSDQHFLHIVRPKWVDCAVNNIYNGNIRIFWHRKLCMKARYSSKSWWTLSIFLLWFFWIQNVFILPDQLFASKYWEYWNSLSKKTICEDSIYTVSQKNWSPKLDLL